MSDNPTPKVYVGTYAKYNAGSIAGKWLEFEDYADADEFWAACRELHADEHDPEFMFQDYEGLPEALYSESSLDVERIYQFLPYADADTDQLRQLASELNAEDGRFAELAVDAFDDDFFDAYFPDKPMEAARAASFGRVNWSDEYIRFNGYGNLESLSEDDLSRELEERRGEIIADAIEAGITV